MAGDDQDLRSTLLDLLPNPVCVLAGADLVCEVANPALRDLLDGRELVGRRMLDAVPELRSYRFDRLLQTAMETGTPFARHEAEISLRRADGSSQELYISFAGRPFGSGQQRKVLVSALNVTPYAAARKAAERQRAEAAEDVRRKDRFIAILAHELRQPLASMVTALELIRRRNDPPTTERGIQVIGRQLRQLTMLTNDLLDASRISEGKLELHITRSDLRDAIRAALEVVAPLMSERRHRLEVSLPSTPVWAEVDPQRLQQVVWNLLTNAAKYTRDDGCISVALEDGPDSVAIRVRDSGIGIAPDLLPRIFDLFTQADAAEGSGLGIGLHVVRTLVAAQGGTVEARSDGRETGSEFVVTLQRSPPPQRPPAAPPPFRMARADLDSRSVSSRRLDEV
jgi:signal transduction histidine kinase